MCKRRVPCHFVDTRSYSGTITERAERTRWTCGKIHEGILRPSTSIQISPNVFGVLLIDRKKIRLLRTNLLSTYDGRFPRGFGSCSHKLSCVALLHSSAKYNPCPRRWSSLSSDLFESGWQGSPKTFSNVFPICLCDSQQSQLFLLKT